LLVHEVLQLYTKRNRIWNDELALN
jgi:hypothetical protein